MANVKPGHNCSTFAESGRPQGGAYSEIPLGSAVEHAMANFGVCAERPMRKIVYERVPICSAPPPQSNKLLDKREPTDDKLEGRGWEQPAAQIQAFLTTTGRVRTATTLPRGRPRAGDAREQRPEATSINATGCRTPRAATPPVSTALRRLPYVRANRTRLHPPAHTTSGRRAAARARLLVAHSLACGRRLATEETPTSTRSTPHPGPE